MADEVFGKGELRTTKNPRVGVLKLGAGTERQYRYSEIEGIGIFEGDIVLARGLELQGIAVVRPGARWPNRTVVYDVDAGLNDTKRVDDAIAHWEAKTVIKFKKRAAEKDYVLFKN